MILLSKLVKIDLPGLLSIGFVLFLTGRSQQCKIDNVLYAIADIGLGIVQGSALVPRYILS